MPDFHLSNAFFPSFPSIGTPLPYRSVLPSVNVMPLALIGVYIRSTNFSISAESKLVVSGLKLTESAQSISVDRAAGYCQLHRTLILLR